MPRLCVRLTSAALLLVAPAVAQADQPNVLLIAVDDLNDWVGALGGHPQAKTPNIDRLAARGTLFANAHCQAPVCSPSRASLATGRLPSTTGMYFLLPALADEPSLQDTVTIAQRFQAEGYETLGVGKVHHGDERPFFDEYGGAMGGFGPRPEAKLAYDIGHPLWDWGAYPERDEQMPDHRVASWAAAKLAEDRDRPFFMAVGFWRPHVPMYAPEPWFNLHPEADVALPVVTAGDREDLPDYAAQLTIGLPAPRHEWLLEHDQWQHAVQSYLASTSFVDACVGRVLDALAASDHADDTIVVLLSDHGFHLGEKERWAKRSLWEESTRVPLIVAAPGSEPGVSTRPVGLVDVYPTLLDLAGLAAAPGLDGHSLAPLLADPGAAWPHVAVTTFGPGNHALRSERWRYIRYADGSEELYDHERDPHEWRNLAALEPRPAAVAAVIATLEAALPTADAPILQKAEGSAGLRAFRAAQQGR
ncbi:MAG: sulfatase [Planctomycetota bacterium]|nr:sulfatase [Planctomycetota bacterium]